MKLIDEVIAKINYLGDSGGASVLADALASACNSSRKVSLFEASISLDEENIKFVIRLCQITREPDYSNAAQGQALRWLRDNKLID